MAIEIGVKIEGMWSYKYITVKRLKEILIALNDNYIIASNSVGNLAIYDNNNWIGYIDLNEEKLEIDEKETQN